MNNKLHTYLSVKSHNFVNMSVKYSFFSVFQSVCPSDSARSSVGSFENFFEVVVVVITQTFVMPTRKRKHSTQPTTTWEQWWGSSYNRTLKVTSPRRKILKFYVTLTSWEVSSTERKINFILKYHKLTIKNVDI